MKYRNGMSIIIVHNAGLNFVFSFDNLTMLHSLLYMVFNIYIQSVNTCEYVNHPDFQLCFLQ
jgi:hypothetical protein